MTENNAPTMDDAFDEDSDTIGDYHRMAAHHFQASATHHMAAASADDDGNDEEEQDEKEEEEEGSDNGDACITIDIITGASATQSNSPST